MKPHTHAPIQKGEQGGLIEQVLKLLRVLLLQVNHIVKTSINLNKSFAWVGSEKPSLHEYYIYVTGMLCLL